MTDTDLTALLEQLKDDVKTVLGSTPTVKEIENPTLEDIKGPGSSTWIKIPNVVAVVADLKSSSQLGTGRHDKSTAKIYQSGVDGAVKILNRFGANFIDIQGDGGFGLFWGEKAYERALCSAVTIRTFSEDFVAKLEAKFGREGSLPEPGYKVGMAADRLLVKTIGTRRDVSEQEAVWPGRAVNHAAKCAQSGNRHQIVVTAKVWDHFKNNDYVTTSCGCGGAVPGATVSDLWREFEIEHIHDEKFRDGYILGVPWCTTHGAEFCQAILEGRKTRTISDESRQTLNVARMRQALESKKARNPKWWRS